MTNSQTGDSSPRVDVEKLRKLEAKATQGPWQAFSEYWKKGEGNGSYPGSTESIIPKDDPTNEIIKWPGFDGDLSPSQHRANAHFIAAARNQLPALLDNIATLEAERDEARRTLYDFKLAVAGGEDAPGSAEAVTVEDVKRWQREEQQRLTTLEAENARLRAVVERDRSAVAAQLTAIKGAIAARRWLSEGRGSFAYDDETYQAEFGHALEEIEAAALPLTRIAGDWSDCPETRAKIIAARSGVTAALDQGEG